LGITDDVTHTSLEVDKSFSTEDPLTVRAVFYVLGPTARWARTRTRSRSSARTPGCAPRATSVRLEEVGVHDHVAPALRSNHPRSSPAYLITRANFVAVHQFTLMEKM
jgi:pyruvate-ferredoxin/flavodoxin oxidoreductase